MSIPGGIKILSIRILGLLASNSRCIMTAMIFHLWLLDSLTHFMDRFLLFLLRPIGKLVNRKLSLQRWFTPLWVLHEICRARVASSRFRPESRGRETWRNGIFWLFDLAKASTCRYLSVRSTVRYSSATRLQKASNWWINTSCSIWTLSNFMI